MDPQFWLHRWQQGQTGWHRDGVMPLLEQHWHTLGLAPGSRILVPLCGKSLDMPWLASQGHRVLGVDLSPLAIQQFFAEHQLCAQVHEAADGTHYVAGAIEIIRGDIFGVAAATLASCTGVYDRAAVIALPATMRERYARQVYARLPAGAQALMITLDYPQAEMDGPPFSVDQGEVQRLFAGGWDIAQLERRDILHSQPSFSAQGVTALHTAVYRLTRNDHAS